MSTFTQLPATLNLTAVKGDTVSVSMDFEQDLTGYAVTSAIVSVPAGATVQAMTTTVTSAAEGRVTVSLTGTQTAAIAAGTYRWEMLWTSPGGSRRMPLSGFFEFVTR